MTNPDSVPPVTPVLAQPTTPAQEATPAVAAVIQLPTVNLSGVPVHVAAQVAKMTPEHQYAFEAEFNKHKKSTGVAYLLWLLLGWHYAYLGMWGWQFLYWFTLGGAGVWAIVDLFRVPKLTRSVNDDRAVAALRDIKIITAG